MVHVPRPPPSPSHCAVALSGSEPNALHILMHFSGIQLVTGLDERRHELHFHKEKIEIQIDEE